MSSESSLKSSPASSKLGNGSSQTGSDTNIALTTSGTPETNRNTSSYDAQKSGNTATKSINPTKEILRIKMTIKAVMTLKVMIVKKNSHIDSGDLHRTGS
ncbi:hypothetical protein BDQ17DRAFT_1432255 [Cyathus striatus]|nr:hypothetical protein BDQ17DRAFT_1432255 [Cyathus striatus]